MHCRDYVSIHDVSCATWQRCTTTSAIPPEAATPSPEPGGSSTISGNTASNNSGDGISTSFGSTVSGNTTNSNDSDGIVANFGSTVQRNSVLSNGNYALNLVDDSAYRENVILSGATSTGTVNGGTNAGANVCNGSLTCP
jgi:hypothetical protein